MPFVKEDPKLLNFYIFNSQFGQKEGHEHEKLLFYYPKTESLDSQDRNVGLSEALTRFTNIFNKKEDCEFLHTQKRHQIFYQPEPDIWMIMTVAVGWVQRDKESGPVREYHSDGVQDQVLKSHLINSYRSFKLSHFTFTSILEKDSSKIKEILSNFFEDYLSTRDLIQGNILTLWNGVSFLPLDKQSFLKVHCTLSLLQTSFPSIVHTAFMYRNNFAWCGFSLEDFQPLSQYLICRLSQTQSEFSASFQSSSSLSSNSSLCSSRHTNSSYSRFLGEGPTPSDIVYILDRKKELRPHHLVVYVLAGASVCMSFAEDEKFSSSMFEKLGRLLEAKVSQLASDIGEQLSKKQEADGFRYLYHNHMNLATKSSIHGINELPVETMQTIVDMHSDLVSYKSSELIVKTALDHWVVGKAGNGRESYIVVSHKNANLVEITDEVNKMCESQFSSIFMID